MNSAPHRGLQPIVSIVLPCYNAQRTISATIRSVLDQQIQDFELIVVDDGSCDHTAELVRDFCWSDERIRLLAQANSGPSAARNAGIANSTASIIAFIDADDIWRNDHLKVHLDALHQARDVGVSFSPCEIFSENGVITGTTHRYTGDLLAADMLVGNPTTTCSTLVVRRQVFEQSGTFRTDMHFAEDQEWLFRILNANWIVRSVNEPTVFYRSGAHGLSAQIEKMRQGWHTFLDHARKENPDLVARYDGQSLRSMHLYLARQALRTGQTKDVRSHVARAITAAPASLFTSPLTTFGYLCACIAPRIVNHAIR